MFLSSRSRWPGPPRHFQSDVPAFNDQEHLPVESSFITVILFRLFLPRNQPALPERPPESLYAIGYGFPCINRLNGRDLTAGLNIPQFSQSLSRVRIQDIASGSNKTDTADHTGYQSMGCGQLYSWQYTLGSGLNQACFAPDLHPAGVRSSGVHVPMPG